MPYARMATLCGFSQPLTFGERRAVTMVDAAIALAARPFDLKLYVNLDSDHIFVEPVVEVRHAWGSFQVQPLVIVAGANEPPQRLIPKIPTNDQPVARETLEHRADFFSYPWL